MSFTVIIPARYGSSRLEGKPLMEIAGKPMVQHVYQQALKSEAADVYVATDDVRIADAVQNFGGKVLMTRADHISGTDRLQECVEQLQLEDQHCVVNVQGDEPEIPPEAISQVAALLQRSGAEMATLSEIVTEPAHLFDPNVVKVVESNGFALYFSRAPIPWCRESFVHGQPVKLPTSTQFHRHIGMYAYQASLLNRFVQWPEGELEGVEKLEQLRVLENGCRIAIAESVVDIPHGVDTQADLDATRKRIEQHD